MTAQNRQSLHGQRLMMVYVLLGCWCQRWRERSGYHDHEEDEAPEPTCIQQERSHVEGRQIRSKVSHRMEMQRNSWARLTTDCRIYKGIVNYTAKQGYRADLRQEAVARASAVRQSRRPKKETPEKKLRGAKARAAEKDT